jgi:hypothetical protein
MITGFRCSSPILLALASATAVGAAASVYADDLPKRKVGLWEMKMSMAGMPAGLTNMQTCVDEKSDDLTQTQARATAKKNCSRNDIKRDGNRVLVHSVCIFDKTTVSSDGVFSGNFDSGYRGDIKTTYDPPMAGRRETQITIEARWLGACQPGQKSGDVTINGMTFNPSSMQGKHAR